MRRSESASADSDRAENPKRSRGQQQGRQDSNLQPPVLETGALPVELRPWVARANGTAGTAEASLAPTLRACTGARSVSCSPRSPWALGDRGSLCARGRSRMGDRALGGGFGSLDGHSRHSRIASPLGSPFRSNGHVAIGATGDQSERTSEESASLRRILSLVAAVDETHALWQDYRKSGDQLLRDRLILTYAPLVKFVAGRVGASLPSHVDEQDLVSYGLLGLIGAIERFDPGREIKFETFAMARIRGAIIDELRSLDWVPRSVRTRADRSSGRSQRSRRSSCVRRPTRRSQRSSG